MIEKQITENENIGQRIDLFLTSENPQFTRSSIKKIIIEGLVQVNEERIMPNYKLKKGDLVVYNKSDFNEFIDKTENFKLKPKNLKLEVIYEDENVIAINKPVGLNSHPVLKNDNNSVLNGIIYHVQNQEEFSKNVKIRLAHRLDQETSGVLLATKNISAHNFYSKLFEKRDIEKEYVAVVKGNVERYLEKIKQDFFYITTHIGKDNKNLKRYKNTDEKNGKLAKTRFFFEDHFNKFGKHRFSIVRAIPETGRTHQIRVHLASQNFPILGDTLYDGQKYKRLMLHAFTLTIPLFGTDDEIELIAELPEKFLDLGGKGDQVEE